MSDRGERLLAAVRADPGLLFELCQALEGEKVVGPWTRSDDDQYKLVRLLPSGKKIALVKRHPTRKVNPWEASLSKAASTDEERPAKNHMQQGMATDWCDMRLLEVGYQLVEEPQ